MQIDALAGRSIDSREMQLRDADTHAPAWLRLAVRADSILISLAILGLVHRLFPGTPWKDPGVILINGWLDKHAEVTLYYQAVAIGVIVPHLCWRHVLPLAWRAHQASRPVARWLAALAIGSLAIAALTLRCG